MAEPVHRLSDPNRLSHLEYVMRRRKQEGRSSHSRSGSEAGSTALLGNVVPAQFPPSRAAPQAYGSRVDTTSASPVPQRPVGTDQTIPQRLSMFAQERQDDRLVEQQRGAQLATERDDIERQRTELLKVRAETKRELEVQRAIAAESGTQLRWQQQQLEQQLGNEREVAERASRVEERLAAREQDLFRAENDAGRRIDAKDAEATRRLNEREGPAGGGAVAYSAAATGAPDPAYDAPTPEGYRALTQKLKDLEAKVNGAMRGPSVDPYDAPLRQDSPYRPPAEPYMQPGHASAAQKAVPQPAPPPLTHYNSGAGPIFSPSQDRSTYAAPVARQNPVPQQSLAARLANRTYDQSIHSRVMDTSTKDAVWEHQGIGDPVHSPVRERDQSALVNATGTYAPPNQTHTDPVGQQTYNATMDKLGSSQTQQMQGGGLLVQGSPQRFHEEPQQRIVQQQMLPQHVSAAMRRESILHDMKSGDYFIKWTRNDKPHCRWFYLNQKKMLLVWTNDKKQSASILMSNHIALTEVISLRSQQLTEEAPGNPGNPQVFVDASRSELVPTPLTH